MPSVGDVYYRSFALMLVNSDMFPGHLPRVINSLRDLIPKPTATRR